MRKIEGVVLALMMLAVVYLVARQRSLEQQIAALSAATDQLREDAPDRQAADLEQMRRVTAQLDRAGLALAAAEKRLTNVVATRASNSRRQAGPGTALEQLGPSDIGTLADSVQATRTDPIGPVSSSHSPDGKLLQRSWGPEQVIGPPDTEQGGDIPTAWAPRSSQGSGEEWLHLGYQQAVELSEVRVRETYNPGAVSRITAVMPNGQEMVVWEGTEPLAQAPVDRSFAVPPGIQANEIKVYLDRQRVSGWNEIDAVELVGRDGTRQWAASAMASSSFAER